MGDVGIGHMHFACGTDVDSAEPRVDFSGVNGGPQKTGLDPDLWDLLC